ncbi:TniQ family protein [Leptolyngbya sp. FACHB-321]|uniref:TniQ family protein n=1 Tax=Leptolyngbya sp. FACHB-321 TaxID=2692807 RepID=UPI0016835B05|nr:TniQ family protein [Leptolyngbya sp. FACHB-321]
MQKDESHQSLLHLRPWDDESISHYLGRWYRQEVVSTDSHSLGKGLRLGKILWRWENFYFNPPPTSQELQKLDTFTGLGIERLLLLFPPEHEPIKPRPVRICAACYTEAPYHRMSWQYQSTEGCEHHRLRLLPKCPEPKCGEPFPLPSQLTVLQCKKCGMPYKTMAKKQKPY